jgi:energy-coupling factor transport system substrate-specific component
MNNFSEQDPKSFYSLRELTYLSLVVSACVVGRLIFQFIPNVQPMTAIFLIITIQLGLSRGLIVCLLSILVTNIYLGMGVWTIEQLFSYFVVLCLTKLICQLRIFRDYVIFQGIFSFVVGFIYGIVISYIDAQIYGMPSFFTYYLQGLAFDLSHAIGNICFYVILAPIFYQLLERAPINKETS